MLTVMLLLFHMLLRGRAKEAVKQIESGQTHATAIELLKARTALTLVI
eukprot:gene32423-41120_t